MSVGLLLSDDLIFTSRIIGTARALGLEVRQARTPARASASRRVSTEESNTFNPR